MEGHLFDVCYAAVTTVSYLGTTVRLRLVVQRLRHQTCPPALPG